MQLRNTASTLWLFLLLSLICAPTAALAQMDDGLGPDSDDVESSDDGLGSDSSNDELMGSDSDEESDGSGDDGSAGEDDFANSEPEEEDDYNYDTEDDVSGPAPPPFEDEEEALETGGPFSGHVQIAVFGGYGMRLAGDKTLNLFGEGRRPEINELNYGPADPNAVAEPVMASTAFELAEQIQDFYRTKELAIEPKPNPFAMSFGARVGITLPEDPLYIGVAFHYFSGGTSSLAVRKFQGAAIGGLDVVTPAVRHTVSVMMMGVEGGLDWDVSRHLVLRPALGVGMATTSSEACTGSEAMNYNDLNSPDLVNPIPVPAICANASSQRIYFTPSLSAIVPLGMMFVGAEGRFMGLSGSGGVVGFYLGASAGVSFKLFD